MMLSQKVKIQVTIVSAFLQGAILLTVMGCDSSPRLYEPIIKPAVTDKTVVDSILTKYRGGIRNTPVYNQIEDQLRVVAWGLGDTPIDDDTCSAVASLLHVKSLSLVVSDNDSLRHIANLRRLESLSLSGSKLNDASLDHLALLSPSLKELFLARTSITDEGLQAIAKLKNLRILSLGGNAISDTGLSHLRTLTQLEKLYMWECDIKGTGLSHLDTLNRLRQLMVWYCPISDEHAGAMPKLPQLEYVGIHGTNLTSKGIKTLQERLSRHGIVSSEIPVVLE